MPISKVPVVHKFGIISQSHRLELQRRLVDASQKAKEDSTVKSSTTRRNQLAVTDEFVRDYNEADFERQQKLNETASQMIFRIKRKIGLNSGGSGSHVDLMKSWTELALLSQCVGNIQEGALDILTTSLDHAPISAGNLPALCYLAETTLYWLRYKASREPFLRSGEIKLLRTGYLVFTRLYYHYLCQRLADMDEFRSRLSDYLDGIDESEKVYCHYPGVHYFLRYIIHIGTLIVGDRNLLEPGELKEGDKIIPGQLHPEPTAGVSQKYSDDEGGSESEQPDSRCVTGEGTEEVRGSGVTRPRDDEDDVTHPLIHGSSDIFREVSAKLEGVILKHSGMSRLAGELDTCVHDVCPSLWHTLDVWLCVTCNDHKKSLPESLRGLLSCGATLDTDNWLDALTTLQVLGETARLHIDVLKCLQTLAKGVVATPTIDENDEQSRDLESGVVEVLSPTSGSTTLRSDGSTLNSQRASKGSVTDDLISPMSTGRSGVGLSPYKSDPGGFSDSHELEDIDTISNTSPDKFQISSTDDDPQPTIKLTLKIIPSLVDSPSNQEETLSSAPTFANISSHESLDSAGHLIVGEIELPRSGGNNGETSESISINTEDRQKEIEKALGLEDPANRVRSYMSQQQELNDKQQASHPITESDIAWGNIEMVEKSKPPQRKDSQNDVDQDASGSRRKSSPVKFKIDSGVSKMETGVSGWYAEAGSNSPTRAGATTRTTYRNVPVPDKPGIQGWYWELAYLYTDVLTNIVIHGATSEIQKLALVGDEPPRMKAVPGTELPLRSVGLVDLLQFGCSPTNQNDEEDWAWRVRYGALHGLVKILHMLKDDKSRESMRTVVWTIVSHQQQQQRDERVLEAMKVGQVDTYIYSVHSAGMKASAMYSLSAKFAQSLSELFLPQSFNKPLVPTNTARPRQKRENTVKNIPLPASNKTRVSLREKLMIANAPNDPVVVDFTNRKMLNLNRVVEDQWRKELQQNVKKQFKNSPST